MNIENNERLVSRIRQVGTKIVKKEKIIWNDLTKANLIFNNEDNSIIVYGDKNNLKYLSTVEIILVDATFKSCSITHKQLFITHALFQTGFSLPVCYVLMNKKSTRNYKKVFNIIENEVKKVTDESTAVFDRENLTVISDFELAIRNSLSLFKC